ncbi:Bacteriocin immunity protein [Acinetobacter baumannii]
MNPKVSFDAWKQQVIEHLKNSLGEEYSNQENLNFLIRSDKSLLSDYEDDYSPLLCAQLIWADNNLQFEQGREISLISNEGYNERS